jgi:hypothetical protein
MQQSSGVQGTPMREFLCDDMAEAVVFCFRKQTSRLFVQCGYGNDLTIKELATIIQKNRRTYWYHYLGRYKA